MTHNSGWFNYLVRSMNTINKIQSIWNVPHAIAEQIQESISIRQSQMEAEAIANASFELRQQVGF